MLLHNSTLGSRSLGISRLCRRCLLRLQNQSPLIVRRQFRTSWLRKESAINQEHFSANELVSSPRNQLKHNASRLYIRHEGVARVLHDGHSVPISPPASRVDGWMVESSTSIPSPEKPHRRRKRLKQELILGLREIPVTAANASSQHPSRSTSLAPSSLRRLLMSCLALAKPRLSFLMVLTTAAAYSLYPVPALLLPSTTTTPSLSAMTLVLLTTGTALCSASANALNMMLEPEHDAKMSRTRNRPIVRGLIGKKGALVFASAAGLVGTGSLWFGVNPTVAVLGALNIGLYAGIYTPLKRISPLNTWVGALVGGIPPMMGWAAAAGQSATGSGGWSELLFSESSIGGWLLAALLYAWQFPHFNGLSWNIREEYRNAGYRMLAWTNPRMNGRVALRYAILLFPICAGLWWFEITDQGFLVTSSVVNAWIVREAWRFWRRDGQGGSARGLFGRVFGICQWLWSSRWCTRKACGKGYGTGLVGRALAKNTTRGRRRRVPNSKGNQT